MERCFECAGSGRDAHDDDVDCEFCDGSGADLRHVAEIDREARRLAAMGEFRRRRAVQKAKPTKPAKPSVKRVTVRLTLELTFIVGEDP